MLMQLGLYSKFINLYFLVSTLYMSLYLHLYKYKTRSYDRSEK